MKSKIIPSRSLTTRLRNITVLILIQALLISSLPHHAFGSDPIDTRRNAFAYGETYGPEVRGTSLELDSILEARNLSGTSESATGLEARGVVATSAAPKRLTSISRGVKISGARPVARTLNSNVVSDSRFAATHPDTSGIPVSSVPIQTISSVGALPGSSYGLAGATTVNSVPQSRGNLLDQRSAPVFSNSSQSREQSLFSTAPQPEAPLGKASPSSANKSIKTFVPKRVSMRTMTAGAEAISAGAVVRHAPSVNAGRIEGSVRQLSGENALLNSGAVITNDLLVPGTPQLIINGSPTFGGTVPGTGSAQPSNYQVTLNGSVQLGRLVTRTDPVSLPVVAAPPASTGTRDISITTASQSPGDFSTLRDLTLNSNVGMFTIPAGTYRTFIANGGAGFVLGVAGSTHAAVYNFTSLTLNGLSNLQVLGPVVITIGGSLSLNASMGSASNPLWVTLRVASGGVTLNGGSSLNGVVVAPSGTVIINGNSTLRGTVFCDRLTVNAGGLLKAFGSISPPAIAITSPSCENAVTNVAQLNVSGTVDDSSPTTVQVNGVGATLTPGAFNASVPIAVGPNVLTAVATNLFNQSAQATRNVTRTSQTNLAPVVNAGPDLMVILPGTANLGGAVSDDGLPTCAALVTAWTKVSGPGAVTFSSPGLPSTAASFSLPGAYVLRLSSSDSSLSGSDDVSVTVFPPNQAPVVIAGSNQTISLPNSATLNGTVSDDGLPPNSTMTIAWSKVSGPGTVTFGSPNQPVSVAAFSQPGSYVLQLSANDTQYSSTSNVTVTVIAQNLSPQVNAGPDQTITLPALATLTGTATDDGLPQGSTLTATWSKISGPGTVTFANATAPSTTASFGAAGTYVLRLSASDSALSASDDVTVTVIAENLSPQVNAGPDLTVTLPALATLSGSATDDGLPQGSTLTSTWSKISGPGTVTFANPNAASTTASFSAAGTYVLRLSASDSALSANDDVTVTVIAENLSPQVNAGPDQTITLPASATLSGTTTDDGLPQGSTLTSTWSKISGPGTVTFANPNAASTTATFGAAGTYVLRLSASDSSATSISNVTITVIAQNTAPVVNAGANQSIQLPTSQVTLNGTATDDGLPQGSTLTISWTKVSGPGTVTFGAPNQPVTTATFGGAGTYILRLSANDTQLTTTSDVTVTVLAADPPPIAAFSVPGVVRPLLATVLASSPLTSTGAPELLLDNDPNTFWRVASPAGVFITVQFSSTEDQLVDRLQLRARQGLATTELPKNFDLQISLTPNAADFVTVFSGTMVLNGNLQEFIFPGGPKRARYAKLILNNNYGSTSTSLGTLNVIALGAHDNVISLPAQENVLLVESPTFLPNGATVVDSSAPVGAANAMLQLGGNSGWGTLGAENEFATIKLAGDRLYTLRGVRIDSFDLADFEVWVSSTTTDATAFTRVLSATFPTGIFFRTFLFPGGPVQAKYVKYIPLNSHFGATSSNTYYFDVIADEAGGVIDVSNVSHPFGLPDMAILNTGGRWTSAASQNQFIKVSLSGGRIHKINGIRLQALSDPPKNFDVRVSTTTSDDSAFTTVFSGMAQNVTTPQEFTFTAPVDAKYVLFFFYQGYSTSTMTLSRLEALATPEDGSLLRTFSSQASETLGVATALDIDTSNGPWTSAAGQNSNQSLVLALPGSSPWLIDQVVLQGGNDTLAAKNFDVLVSTTDTADSSFTLVSTGTLQAVKILQAFRFAPVGARFIKLLVKDNYGSASQVALNTFFAISPQLGSTNARFMDRSTVSSGAISTIASWAWDFGDGGTSADRDPLHVYAQPGTFTVKLTVTTGGGQTATSQLLYHALAPLQADFTFSPLFPYEGVFTQFQDRSSPRLGAKSIRRWDPTGAGPFSNGASLSFKYADNGTYQATLTVGDRDGAYYSTTKAVPVLNSPPTMEAFAGKTLVWGQPWTPEGVFLSDPGVTDAFNLRCNWAYGDAQGTEIFPCFNANASPPHIYLRPGSYTTTLSVFDKDGGAVSNSVINYVSKRPTAFTGLNVQTPGTTGSLTFQTTLIDDYSKLPLSGRSVTFAVGSNTATATSDASGNAQATVLYAPASDAAIASVFYSGDDLYSAGGRAVEVAGQPGVRRCTSGSRGTDFWLMMPGNGAGSPVMKLFISSDTATTGVVTIPGVSFNAAFTVQPGIVTAVTLPAQALVSSSDLIETKGIHVVAQAPVSVYGLESFLQATDTYLGLPTSGLGTSYITLSYKNVDALNASDFGIVASANDTHLTITPSDTVGAHTAGTPFNITLNQGQTYQLSDRDNFPSDLTGTLITADKPVAVFGGHEGANIPSALPFANPIFEQLPPTTSWARGFALLPSATRLGDTIRCLASVDNTHVYVNGSLVATLNRGQFVERLVTGPTHVIADQPIMVAQYAHSATFDSHTGDPYMLIVPGYTQFMDRYTVTTAVAGFPINYVSVVVPTAALGTVTLDGVPIAISLFTAIDNSGYSGAQVPVATGSHALAGPEPFGVSVYGFANSDAYGSGGGMCLTSQVTSVQMTLAPVTANAPTGISDCVTATLTDLANNPVGGVRVTFTVTGVNPATGSSITDSLGQAQFCYTGNIAGSDLITASAAGINAIASKNWGSALNQPPAVSAGPDQTISLPTTSVVLSGAATDDGLPLTGSLTVAWTQVSGPAGVIFANPTSASTTASLPAQGTYGLQLAATDGQYSATDTTTIILKPALVNQAPVVNVAHPATIFFEDNLILNGDNEAALISGQIPSWTVVSGAWSQGTAATGVPLFNGAKYFSAGQSATAEIRQDVDVTAWGGPINLQAQQFELGAWVRSKDESPADIARIILEYRDPTNSFTLASLDTGPIVSTAEWSQVSDRRTAPAGTGFIRVRLIATRAAGSTNDAVFDQVTLRALGSAAVHFNGIVTDDGLPAGSILTYAWSINISDYPMQFADASQPVTTATFYTNGASTQYRLRLTASDSQLSGLAQFDIGVAPSNQAPVVNAGENQSITLPNSATVSGNIQDDGRPIAVVLTKTWSLVSGPGTVTFSTGDQLATNVSFSAAGVYVLQLKVSDSQYSAASDVTISVGSSAAVNQAPVVSAGLNQTTTLPYTSVTLNGAAADDGLPQGSHLIVAWTQVSGPAQATFSVPNAVSSTVTLPAVGVYVFKLTASDGALSSNSTVTVTLNPAPPANQAPVVSPGPNQTITLPISTTTLNGSVQDDGLPEGAQLTATWTQVSGPGTVTFSTPSQAVTQASFSAAGQYLLQLTVSDTEFTVFKQVVVTVNPEPPPPGGTVTVNIDSPGSDINITQPTPIVATISGGTWTLKYSPNADEDLTTRTWTTLASGTGAVTGATIATFDPTLLLNGTYLIRLTSQDGGGNVSLDQIGVNVRGQQKIGNFTLSFNDLSVPVAGLPIQVIRTYDSRDKSAGDFGSGWTLAIKNVRVEKSATLGKLWDETYTPGILPKYCIEPTRPQTVTITFGDGRQYRFNTVPSPQCQLAAPLTGGDMTYVQIPSDSRTGGATLVAVGNNAVIVDAAVPGIVNLINVTDQRIYNPTVFRLTTAEGYTYTIDQKLGVTAMADLHGNTLAINSTGIIHSSGKSIVFTRDAQGRITRITDPAGNSMSYNINAAGDLVGFTDRENNTTNFSYNATHGLLDITDPRGIKPIRNDYDSDGRLIKHTDAFGKTINYTHNISAHHEEITDRLGHTSVYEYDDFGNVLRMTDALGHATTMTYDDHDNKLTETNALGKTTTFTYDAKDNLTSQTDPLGNKTRYTYNDRRQVLTVTDPKNNVATNTYEFNGNLLSNRDALGNMTTMTYTQQGVADTVTDALGGVSRYGYDAQGNVLGETDALGHATAFTYDANGNCLSQTTTRTLANGSTETLSTTFDYDKLNRLTKTTYADGSTTQVIYNSIGRQSIVIDQLGRQSSFQYDEMGRVASTSYPDATIESSTYDAEGRRITSTDRAGRTTTFEYDELGRLKKTIYADGSFGGTTSYDEIGRVKTSTDPRANTTQYDYDSANRRTKVIDALNHETTFSYDANGNQASMTDGRNNSMTYEYDSLNRQTKMVYADLTFSSTTYDALGRATAKTDQAGKTTQFEFDKLGRLTKVTDALNQQTRYSYDELGNQRTQTDANNHTTSVEYDKLGRRTKRTLPLGMSETYSYNAAGNLMSRTDFRGKTTTYSYDSMNRLIRKTPDASLAEPLVSFTYTATGRRASMSDASGMTSYSYDLRDRLTAKATPQGTLSYSYDVGSNLLTMRSSNTNGASVNYSYDEMNRLSTVTDNPAGTRPGSGSTSYSYDQVGNLDSFVYPNGVKHAYTYNSLNRLSNVATTNATATTLASFTYTLGPAGNRNGLTELSGRQVNYSYDDLYRLTAETISSDPVVANNGAISYVYDPVGNRQSRTSTIPAVPSTSSSYDANDRLSSDTYDANGSTTASGGKVYKYDFENRIIAMNPGTSNAVTFVYDAEGNRVSKTVNGVTTKFLVHELNPTGYMQVVEEIVGGSVQRSYVHGHSLISQTRLINSNWTTSFYGYDGHGSVCFLSDPSGAITDSYDYDAFGILIHRDGALANHYLFSGEQFDSDIGLYYQRARYFSPLMGRFLSIDTKEGNLRDPRELHRYLYCLNNPVNRTDRSGQESLEEQSLVLTFSTRLGAISVTIPLQVLASISANLAELLLEEIATTVLEAAAQKAARALASKELAEDMAAKKTFRPSQSAAHHIVAFDDPDALPARQILEHYDVPINSADNGVYLPNKLTSPTQGAYHPGLHTSTYYAEVNNRLAQATSRSQVIEILEGIRSELIANTFPY